MFSRLRLNNQGSDPYSSIGANNYPGHIEKPGAYRKRAGDYKTPVPFI